MKLLVSNYRLDTTSQKLVEISSIILIQPFVHGCPHEDGFFPLVGTIGGRLGCKHVLAENIHSIGKQAKLITLEKLSRFKRKFLHVLNLTRMLATDDAHPDHYPKILIMLNSAP